jgi:hypothetical protein
MTGLSEVKPAQVQEQVKLLIILQENHPKKE